MISDEITKDESLLRCTIKKSISVLKKVGLYVLYAVVIGVAIAGLGYVGYIGLPVIMGICSVLITSLISLLVSIPWYYYVGAVAIAVIPVYSFLWCIARDLTDEDWRSKAANNAALALADSAIALTLIAFAAFALALVAFALALVLAFDPVNKITIWYYIFRFVGAVWHHYKQKKIKEELK